MSMNETMIRTFIIVALALIMIHEGVAAFAAVRTTSRPATLSVPVVSK